MNAGRFPPDIRKTGELRHNCADDEKSGATNDFPRRAGGGVRIGVGRVAAAAGRRRNPQPPGFGVGGCRATERHSGGVRFGVRIVAIDGRCASSGDWRGNRAGGGGLGGVAAKMRGGRRRAFCGAGRRDRPAKSGRGVADGAGLLARTAFLRRAADARRCRRWRARRRRGRRRFCLMSAWGIWRGRWKICASAIFSLSAPPRTETPTFTNWRREERERAGVEGWWAGVDGVGF